MSLALQYIEDVKFGRRRFHYGTINKRYDSHSGSLYYFCKFMKLFTSLICSWQARLKSFWYPCLYSWSSFAVMTQQSLLVSRHMSSKGTLLCGFFNWTVLFLLGINLLITRHLQGGWGFQILQLRYAENSKGQFWEELPSHRCSKFSADNETLSPFILKPPPHLIKKWQFLDSDGSFYRLWRYGHFCCGSQPSIEMLVVTAEIYDHSGKDEIALPSSAKVSPRD